MHLPVSWLPKPAEVQALEMRSFLQIAKQFNLDEKTVEVERICPSRYGTTDMFHNHVHDIMFLNIEGESYIGKPEDVYLDIKKGKSFDYASFRYFVESIFLVGEYNTPSRTFFFPDDPEIRDFEVKYSDIQPFNSLLPSIRDDTPPHDISDPLLRKVFVLYLHKKDQLIRYNGKTYENVFYHHGRDVINGVLASVFGRALNVKVPENYLGIKHTLLPEEKGNPYSSTDPEIRYVVSKSLQLTSDFVSLDKVLVSLFKEKLGESGMERMIGFDWKDANPLKLDHFYMCTSKEDYIKGSLITDYVPAFEDLIISDFLDRFLMGSSDRKLSEFLLPKGVNGPVYTIDFGEILFPELEFDPHDLNYIQKKEESNEFFINYLEKIKTLPDDSLYKKVIAGRIIHLLLMRNDFFRCVINYIPPFFFKYHWDNSRHNYHPESIIDFFECRVQAVREWAGVKVYDSFVKLAATIRKKFGV